MLPYLRKDYDTSRTGSQVVPATPLRSRYLKRTVICRDNLHAYPFTVCRYYITNKDFVQPINNTCMCSPYVIIWKLEKSQTMQISQFGSPSIVVFRLRSTPYEGKKRKALSKFR